VATYEGLTKGAILPYVQYFVGNQVIFAEVPYGIGGGAARTILTRAYGRKHHDITMSDNAIPDVVLHYTDLMDITDDVIIARIAGGIHFRVDQDVGDRMGGDVARYNDEHWLLPAGRDDD